MRERKISLETPRKKSLHALKVRKEACTPPACGYGASGYSGFVRLNYSMNATGALRRRCGDVALAVRVAFALFDLCRYLAFTSVYVALA